MKFTESQLKQIVQEELQEIFAPGERSSEVEESDALEDARAKVMTQLKALLNGPDAMAARITPEKIDRIMKGFWRVLVEESK